MALASASCVVLQYCLCHQLSVSMSVSVSVSRSRGRGASPKRLHPYIPLSVLYGKDAKVTVVSHRTLPHQFVRTSSRSTAVRTYVEWSVCERERLSHTTVVLQTASRDFFHTISVGGLSQAGPGERCRTETHTHTHTHFNF